MRTRHKRRDKTRGTHSSLSFAEPYGPRKTPGRICLDAGQRAVSERRLSALLQRRARPSYGSAQRQSPKERLGCAPTGKNLLHLPAHLIRPLHEEVSAAQSLRCLPCITLSSPLSRADSRFTFPVMMFKMRRSRRLVFPQRLPVLRLDLQHGPTCSQQRSVFRSRLSRQCRPQHAARGCRHHRAACWRCRSCCAVSWRTQVPLACTY